MSQFIHLLFTLMTVPSTYKTLIYNPFEEIENRDGKKNNPTNSYAKASKYLS